jgi:hypothetical protein
MRRGFFPEKTRHALLRGGIFLSLGFVLFCTLLCPVSAQAQCITCTAGDCSATEQTIVSDHVKGRAAIKQHMARAFQDHETWWENIFWKQILLPAMMKMTEQLTAVGIYQMMGIGMEFDAKEQLETQQMMQKMQARALKDYTPSTDFCAVGTNTRSLAASTEKSRHNVVALGELALERQLGPVGSVGAAQGSDRPMRWQQFIKTYCNRKDNGYQVTSYNSGAVTKEEDTGLQAVCEDITDENRLNIDVDYRRQVEEPLTIDADFTDGEKTNGEEDLIALARNLYGHSVLTRNTPNLTDLSGALKYMTLRSVAAKRAVAENSFYNIAGLKLSGSDPEDAGTRKKTKETMAAVLKQLGMPENEIPAFIGEKPSVYSQLEILAKKIFQSTDFFASLYDKPANVERRKVAMAAIGLMVDRAIYESRLRQEMLASVLVSARLSPEVERIQTNLAKTKPGG